MLKVIWEVGLEAENLRHFEHIKFDGDHGEEDPRPLGSSEDEPRVQRAAEPSNSVTKMCKHIFDCE